MLPLDTLFCKSCGHCINSVLRKTYLSLSYTDPSISMPRSRSVFSLRGPNVQRNNNLLFNDVYEKSDLMSFRSKRFSYFKIKQWKCLALTESKVPSSMDRTHVLIYSFWGIILSYHIWIEQRKVILVQLKYIINKREQNFKTHDEIAYSINGTSMWKYGICPFNTVFQELAHTDYKLFNKTESCPPSSMELLF